MRRGTDELETRLTSLLREQAESVPVTARKWNDAQTSPLARMRSRRTPFVARSAAAVVCVVLALVLAGGGDKPQQVRTGPAASDDAPPALENATIPPPGAGALRVETRQVALTADAVVIDAGGKQFRTVAPINVSGDPGKPYEYTTLELTWQEHAVDMRLFMYFTSDGREWWSNEIRTYDGSEQGGWITYTGDFFRRPLGEAFTGDFTVAAPDPAVGRLHIPNMALDAFRPPPGCATAPGPFLLEPGTSPIKLEGLSSGYGAAVRLYHVAANCPPVADEDRYRYDWQPGDPAVVMIQPSVFPMERRADLKPVGKGSTTIHVTARDPETGAIVAETDIDVEVGDVEPFSGYSPSAAGPGPGFP